ncbi:MAG: hypothetical protein ASARMPRED_007335 [Alectoria sarmentosa]|nr:MAG: hypothetical protein ASARMPRED_007335 [Alectoria sarmentosa]
MADDPERDAFPGLTQTDRENLAGGDENFKPHNWQDLIEIIAANNLAILKRKPSDLHRYINWTNQTKAKYGSITAFILIERLHWEALPSVNGESPSFQCKNTIPFVDPTDYKVLLNHWPYGFTSDVTHIVIWSKIRIPEQKPKGNLTPESVALVQGFVQRTFVEPLSSHRPKPGVSGDSDTGSDRVLWFRNWTGLQSVRGLEHVHVLVRDAPKDLLDWWVGDRV